MSKVDGFQTDSNQWSFSLPTSESLRTKHAQDGVPKRNPMRDDITVIIFMSCKEGCCLCTALREGVVGAHIVGSRACVHVACVSSVFNHLNIQMVVSIEGGCCNAANGTRLQGSRVT